MDNIADIIRILTLFAIAFVVTIIWTPLLANFLYKYRLGKQIRDGGTPIYTKLHRKKEGTPTMGGLLVWVTTLVLAIVFWALARFTQFSIFDNLNFLTRSQTLLPLGALVISALVGLFDDILGVKGIGPKGGGLRMRHRLLLYSAIAIGGAWWFYYKLDWDLIHVPVLGDFFIGWWYIPVFIFIIVATAFSANEADGLDGLAGGVLLIAYGAYGAIAFAQGKTELAIFCSVIAGALLAFLWFNIYPARFFMGDTGSMPLGVTLGIVAMLTNSVLVLPLIAFILVLESGSVIVQIISRKLTGKKVFLSTPIHHHFEARGWPETKVTMRFWIVAGVIASLGLVIGLLG